MLGRDDKGDAPDCVLHGDRLRCGHKVLPACAAS